jgi:hypothetical protein
MQLILHVGPDETTGPALRLPPGQYVVGRDADCHIRLPKRAVSRRHCLLTVGPNRASVRDLGSRNHTLLNSRPVTDERSLRGGDRLSVSGTVLWVVFREDTTTDPAWVTIPPGGPGVVLGLLAPQPESHAVGGTVALDLPGAGLVPGTYDIPLNVPGHDSRLHLDVRHPLGRGAFGQVWWARTRGASPDWHDGVLKVAHQPDGTEAGDLCRWGALAAAQLPAHPNLLRPRMVAAFGRRPLVETEAADNSLADLAGALPRADLGPRLLAALRDAAAGLDHLHANGLVHGCPKPADILFIRGLALVGDWDLAHPAHVAEGARAAVRHGDPAYLAPEVWVGWACGQSDQYALACGYAELRSGRRVFPVWRRTDWERCHRSEEPDLGGLPAGERSVVGCALAKDPDRRFSSCREFARALVAAARPDGTPGTGSELG